MWVAGSEGKRVLYRTVMCFGFVPYSELGVWHDRKCGRYLNTLSIWLAWRQVDEWNEC